jgi:phosphotriesterase-related protein
MYNGKEVRNYNYLSVFLPALHNSGISEATIRKLMVENPANAFAIRFSPITPCIRQTHAS